MTRMKYLGKMGFVLLVFAGLTFTATAQRTIDSEAKLKFDDVMELVSSRYVDTVDQNQLVEDAIRGFMKDLDPHSEYYTADEYEKMNEPLKGNFEGIGIQFNIIKDTITVVSPISGGPSEKLGINSGDKIVKIGGENVAGIGITNNDVVKQLRGAKGTEVTVTIFRKSGGKKNFDVTIVRDEIPIFSVDASYMLTPDIGYIKVNRFAETTMDEFQEGMAKLGQSKMKHLVLDLRGNSGGYLKTAISLADEFLDDKNLIVYTEGVSSPKREYFSTNKGSFEEGKLVVLIDEGSASASEIVSGAVQDWDRGLVIGRRSFGKGLVQGPFKLRDNSVLKLTTARYYTPTGRCIQRPYDEGIDEYRQEGKRRMEDGELFSEDSISFADSLKFFTPNKRVVYGGGGIKPDVFVPLDTSMRSDYLGNLISEGILLNFTNEYIDENRPMLVERFETFEEFDEQFQIDAVFMEKFVAYAEKEGVKRDDVGMATSDKMIRNQLKARIAQGVWKTEGYFRVINQMSDEVQKAISAIEDDTFKELKIAYK